MDKLLLALASVLLVFCLTGGDLVPDASGHAQHTEAVKESATSSPSVHHCGSCPAKLPLTTSAFLLVNPNTKRAPFIHEIPEKTASLASTLFRPPKSLCFSV